METTGQIKDIQQTFPARETVVTVKVAAAPAEVESLIGKQLTVILKRFRKKRTMNQNAYYWKLIGMVSDKSGLSGARLHNELLREHPHPVIDDRTMSCWDVWMDDTEENFTKALESTTYHLYPMDAIDSEGRRQFRMIRGSSTFDSAEMGALLDSLIERAKEYGVETLTPDEIARMRAMEEGHAGHAEH